METNDKDLTIFKPVHYTLFLQLYFSLIRLNIIGILLLWNMLFLSYNIQDLPAVFVQQASNMQRYEMRSGTIVTNFNNEQ